MSEGERDDLEAFIARRTAKNPGFPALVEAAQQRHALEREALARRERLGLTAEGIADPARDTAARPLPRKERSEHRAGNRAAAGGR
jgi:hypothetical protein